MPRQRVLPRFSPWLWMALLAWPAALGQVRCAEPVPPPADAPPAGLEILPAVVAQVDGHPITWRELVRELVGSAAGGALDRLMRRMLVEQAAEEAGIRVTAEEMDAQLELDRNGLPNEWALVDRKPWDVGEKTFEALVRTRYQMTLEEYKTQVIRQRLLIRKAIGRNLQPTEADLRRFFADHQDLFQPQTRYRAAHILITPLSPRDLHVGTRLKSPVSRKYVYEKMSQEIASRNPDKSVRAFLDEASGKLWAESPDARALVRRSAGPQGSSRPEMEAEPEWIHARKRALLCVEELRSGRISWEQAVEKYTQDPHDLRPVVDEKSADQCLGELQDRKAPWDEVIRKYIKFRVTKGRRMPSFREWSKLKPGEVGEFTRNGPLVEEFYEGSKDLPLLKPSDPIWTQFGYHIVRLLDKQEARPSTFEEIREWVEKTYVDWTIQALSEKWMDALAGKARLEDAKAQLWPAAFGATPEPNPNPVVGKVNGRAVLRGEVWRELLRSEGPAALQRLINREMALGPLKRLGPDRLTWEGTLPGYRPPAPPYEAPLQVTAYDIDKGLEEDRLRWDGENEALRKQGPKASPRSFEQYLFERYGQTEGEFRRSIEAGVVFAKAVRKKADLAPANLQFQFALARDRYIEPVHFKASHILKRALPGAEDDTRQELRKLVLSWRNQLIEEQTKWETLVAHSDDESTKDAGGDLGTLKAGPGEHPELYAALAKGKWEKGQLADPIETPLGIHLVRVDARYEERAPDFEEVKAAVERDYLRGRALMYMDIWIRSMQRQTRIKRFLYEVETLDIPDLAVPK